MDHTVGVFLVVTLRVSMATVVDLTHTYDENVLYLPQGPEGKTDLFNFTIMHRGYSASLDSWYEKMDYVFVCFVSDKTGLPYFKDTYLSLWKTCP